MKVQNWEDIYNRNWLINDSSYVAFPPNIDLFFIDSYIHRLMPEKHYSSKSDLLYIIGHNILSYYTCIEPNHCL